MVSFRSSKSARSAATEQVLDHRLGGVHRLVESQLALVDILEARVSGLGRERIAVVRKQLAGIDVRIDAARQALRGRDAGRAADVLGCAIDDANAVRRELAAGPASV